MKLATLKTDIGKFYVELRASLGQPLRLHPASYPCRTGGRGRSGGFALSLPLSLGLVAYSCIKGKGYAHHPHPFGARPSGSAPLRPAVMPLTQLPAIEQFLQR